MLNRHLSRILTVLEQSQNNERPVLSDCTVSLPTLVQLSASLLQDVLEMGHHCQYSLTE